MKGGEDNCLIAGSEWDHFFFIKYAILPEILCKHAVMNLIPPGKTEFFGDSSTALKEWSSRHGTDI